MGTSRRAASGPWSVVSGGAPTVPEKVENASGSETQSTAALALMDGGAGAVAEGRLPDGRRLPPGDGCEPRVRSDVRRHHGRVGRRPAAPQRATGTPTGGEVGSTRLPRRRLRAHGDAGVPAPSWND
jgi:hypothetical protein